MEKQILEILEEIGYTKSLKVIRYLSYMLTKAFLTACSGIYVNYEGLLKVNFVLCFDFKCLLKFLDQSKYGPLSSHFCS